MEKEKLSESLEDYLEMIHLLVNKNKVARVKDIASALNVKKSSVTNALQNLSKRKLINYNPYSYVTLTPSGEKHAKSVIKRHKTLKDFMVKILGIEEINADKNACRLEHAMDKVVFARMLHFLEYIEVYSQYGTALKKDFSNFCKREKKI